MGDSEPRKKISSQAILSAKEQQAYQPEPDLIDDELRDLYEEQGNENNDFSKINRASRKGRVLFITFIIVMFALAIGGAFVGWKVWSSQPTFVQENVLLSVKGADEITSGDEVIYVVQYSNIESIGIKDVEINVRYPSGFVFETAIPEPIEKDNIWRYENISSRQSGQIKIRGYMVGELDSTQTITAAMTYTPLNFNSEFKELASHTASISDVPLSLELTGPADSLLGEQLEYKVKYKNKLTTEIKDARIRLELPDTFSLAKSEPALKVFDDQQYWQLYDIIRDGELTFTGSFDSLESTDQVIKVIFMQGVNDRYYDQTTEELKVAVAKSDLDISLIQNGSLRGKGVAFGQSLRYTIIAKNTSESLMENISLKTVFNTTQLNRDKDSVRLIDWTTLNMSIDGKVKDEEADLAQGLLESKSITWSSKEVNRLAELSPDEEVEIPFVVDLYTAEAIRREHNIDNVAGFILDVMVQASVGSIGGKSIDAARYSNKITNKISSDFDLDTKVFYYSDDGPDYGSGPMPPRVGDKTTYRVFWTITNSVDAMKDIYVITVLPPDVTWANNFEVEAGDMVYDANKNSITWNIDKLPLVVKKVDGYFDISVVPQAEDVDSLKTILGKTTLKGFDSVINMEVSKSIKGKTTALNDDPNAEGEALVTE